MGANSAIEIFTTVLDAENMEQRLRLLRESCLALDYCLVVPSPARGIIKTREISAYLMTAGSRGRENWQLLLKPKTRTISVWFLMNECVID